MPLSTGYAAKYRNPKWAERRNQILQRDDFTCRNCDDKDGPIPDAEEDQYKAALEVHHKYYEWGKDPWDYPDNALITLCETCHDKETAYRKEAEKELLRAIQIRFLSKEMFALASAFRAMRTPFAKHEKAGRILAWAMTNQRAMDLLTALFQEDNKTMKTMGEFLDGYFEKWMDQACG